MFESMAMVRASTPISGRLEPLVVLGLQRHDDGEIDLRDAVIGLGWRAWSSDRATLQIQPGVNVPIGSVEDGLSFTPLSSGSFDPFLQVDFVYGAGWLVGTTGVVRTPLYAGSDAIRQGTFGRLDVWGARRWGDVVPWAGLSTVGQTASVPIGAPDAFAELAATAGAVVNLGRRFSLTGQLRIPVPEVATRHAVRGVAGGIGLSTVIGGTIHHEGDGHDHGAEGHTEDDGHDHGG